MLAHVIFFLTILFSPNNTTYLPVVRYDYHRESKKGVALAVWTDACSDLRRVGARRAVGWHPAGPACIYDSPDLIYTPTYSLYDRDIGLPAMPHNTNDILTFNEPNLCPGSSCLPMDQAISGWHKIMLDNPGRDIFAPSIAGIPGGIEWLTSWMEGYIAAYGDLHIAGFSFHCYQGEAGCTALTNQMLELCKEVLGEKCRMKVTEFSVRECEGYSPDTWEQETIALLNLWESIPEIDEYDFYTNRTNWPPLLPGCDPVLYDFNTGEHTDQGLLYLRHP